MISVSARTSLLFSEKSSSARNNLFRRVCVFRQLNKSSLLSIFALELKRNGQPLSKSKAAVFDSEKSHLRQVATDLKRPRPLILEPTAKFLRLALSCFMLAAKSATVRDKVLSLEHSVRQTSRHACLLRQVQITPTLLSPPKKSCYIEAGLP